MSWISINLICLDIYQHWYASNLYQLDMFGYYQCWYASNFYQLDMCWIFINVDMLPIYINLICLDIYQHWYASNLYQLDMCWTFIKLICLGYLSTWYVLDIKLIWLQFLSTWYFLDIINTNRFWIFISTNMFPISINWICLGYLFTVIELQILSSWYINTNRLDIYSQW
jgi:hypothetical protein